ncbi:hypothetical protein LTR17_022654 [Elasticomyces elasticus]|nr:hypothetical protein LTR17_022654 [Elasticomyces elasticus]
MMAQQTDAESHSGVLALTRDASNLTITKDSTKDLDQPVPVVKVKGQSASAAHFVPVGPYDVTFSSLRMVIFDIEETSATLVAHTMREMIDNNQICDLLQGVSATKPKQRPEALMKKIADARVRLSENLRDFGFVDVDVIYSTNVYRVEPFQTDKLRVIEMGGNVYHMYPFKPKEQEMAYSVVVQPWILDRIYPEAYRKSLGVRFKTNTAPAPAPPKTISVTLRPNSIYPFERQVQAGGFLDPMQQVDNIIRGFEVDKRNNDVLKKVKISSRTNRWNLFNSTFRPTLPPWAITEGAAEDGPFTGTPGIHGNDDWWIKDLTLRLAHIGEWERTTRLFDEPSCRWIRSIVTTGKTPQQAKAGVDFAIVESMSKIFVPQSSDPSLDCNYRSLLNKYLEEYQGALESYDSYMIKVEHFYIKYAALQLDHQSETTDFENWQDSMQKAPHREQVLLNELQQRAAFLQMKAARCNKHVDLKKFAVAGQMKRKMQATVSAALKKRPAAVAAVPASVSPAERPDTPRPTAPNQHHAAPWLPTPNLPFRRIPAMADLRRASPAVPVQPFRRTSAMADLDRAVTTQPSPFTFESTRPARAILGRAAPAEPILSPPVIDKHSFMSDWRTISSKDSKMDAFPAYNDTFRVGEAPGIVGSPNAITRPVELPRARMMSATAKPTNATKKSSIAFKVDSAQPTPGSKKVPFASDHFAVKYPKLGVSMVARASVGCAAAMAIEDDESDVEGGVELNEDEGDESDAATLTDSAAPEEMSDEMKVDGDEEDGVRR